MRILSKILTGSLLSALILGLAAYGNDVSRDLQAVVQSEQRLLKPHWNTRYRPRFNFQQQFAV